jgi:hypothetical protein
MSRDEFMLSLAELIRPRAPRAAALQLEKMLPFLTDVPDDAFMHATLTIVAKQLKRVPLLADVRAALLSTQKSHAAADAPAEQSESFAALAAEDQGHARAWRGHSALRDLSHTSLTLRLDVLRYHVPNAFHWLINNDEEASEIAARNRWNDKLEPYVHPTEEDKIAVRNSVIASKRKPWDPIVDIEE